MERSLRVLDGAIAVFCGVAGVQPQSETVWRQANKYGVPRIAFVNKMDRVGANFANAVNEMRDKLGANAWPVLLPWGAEDQLHGQIDVVNQKAVRYADNDKIGSTYELVDIPSELKPAAEKALQELIEAVADKDEEIGNMFLEEKKPTPMQLKQAIRRLTVTNQLVPVAGGSAFKNKGVQFLIDAVIDYLPGPLDIPPAQGINPHNREEKVPAPADDNAQFCSLAFKLWTDPFVGKLVFFRVYSGQLTKGTTVYNPRTNKRDRISRVVQIQADKREELETVYAGDIAAIVGIKDVKTGDTLCVEDFDIQLEPPSFPDPLSPWPSSQRRRPTAKRWVNRLGVWSKKIRPSRSRPTRKPARPLSPAWANCTSTSSWTACAASSTSRPTPARRRSRIANRLPSPPKAKASSSSSRAVAVNTATSSST